MGKVANERRRRIVEEVKQADEQKQYGQKLREVDSQKNRPIVDPDGTKRYKELRRAESERKKKLVGVCCEDKGIPMPEAFRRCIDCPKLTEAGPNGEVVAQNTEAGSKQRWGAKDRGGVKKPRGVKS